MIVFLISPAHPLVAARIDCSACSPVAMLRPCVIGEALMQVKAAEDYRDNRSGASTEAKENAKYTQGEACAYALGSA